MNDEELKITPSFINTDCYKLVPDANLTIEDIAAIFKMMNMVVSEELYSNIPEDTKAQFTKT